ncbi:MAG TPA: hypothetical protein VGN16_09470 [Acidobacteriaceae bacterium]|jgi:hypothetical protein
MSYNPYSIVQPRFTPLAKPYPSVSWVTPGAFGAVGDGVTDDTAAIQAAISLGYSIDFGSNTYRIATGPLVFDQPDVYYFCQSATLLFDGTTGRTRLADITASGVTFDGNFIFDGNNKQVYGSLVALWANVKNCTMYGPTFQNIMGTHVSAVQDTASNCQYGLSINPYGCSNFALISPRFISIHNDNSGVNVSPLEGGGFCGGIFFYPETFPGPIPTTDNASDPSSGTIVGLYMENISTILLNGLGRNDQINLQDADGIRSVGEYTTGISRLPVTIHGVECRNVAKRCVKISGTNEMKIFGVTVYAGADMQYQMVTAMKLDGYYTELVGFNAYATSGMPIRQIIQTHDANFVSVRDAHANFCEVFWDFAPSNPSGELVGYYLSHITCDSVSDTGLATSTSINAITQCTIDTLYLVAAAGTHGINALSFVGSSGKTNIDIYNARIIGGDIRLAGSGWSLSGYQEINDANYAGNTPTAALLGIGDTPGASHNESLLHDFTLNVVALPDGYFSVSRPNAVAISGDHVTIQNTSWTWPTGLTISFFWLTAYGFDQTIDDFRWFGVGGVKLADGFSGAFGPYTGLRYNNMARLVTANGGANAEFLWLYAGQNGVVTNTDDIMTNTAGVISVQGGSAGGKTYAWIINGLTYVAAGGPVSGPSVALAKVINDQTY